MADEQAVITDPAPVETNVEAVAAAPAPAEETKTETSEKTEVKGSEPVKDELGEKGKAEILKLRKRAQEAERELARQQGILEGMKLAGKKEEPVLESYPVPKPVQNSDEPFEDFVLRLQNWNLDSRQWVQEKKTSSENQVKVQQTRQEKAAAQIRLGEAEYEDFSDIAKKVVLPFETLDEIMDSDIGNKIVHELGTNSSEYERIKALPVMKQIKEIARLEDRLRAGAVTKPITKAPEPPPIVKASTVQTEEQRYMSDDISAAERIRLSQERKAARYAAK